MNDGIENTVALITGGAGGLGKAIAEKLAVEGCTIMLNDIDAVALNETVKDFTAKGFKVSGLVGDISSKAEVQRMTDDIIDTASRLDILINNAGISYKKDGNRIPLLEVSEEQWNHVLSVNLTSAFLCSQAAAKHMMAQNYGRIINMASMAGKLGESGPACVDYCASKAGLISLTKTLAFELAPYGITVNAVAPGVIRTEMMTRSSEETNRKFIEKIPLKRFGNPKDVAEAVYYLVSDAAAYITGEILDVNGGMVMD